MDLNLVTFLAKVLAILLALALTLRARLGAVLVWVVAEGLVLLVIVLLVQLFPAPGFGFDYRIFWRVGHDVWAGVDPYGAARFADHPFLNPPTALPLFAAFALLPLTPGLTAWVILNVAACVALPLLAQHALLAQERLGGSAGGAAGASWRLPGAVLAGLGAAFLLSGASVTTLLLGQLSLLEAVALVAALAAQGRGRPAWAGAALALATVKVATMLPFLLLFLRKPDWRGWLSLAAVSLALCLAGGSPLALPGRAVTLLDRIKELEAPGRVNDYSFEGPKHVDMMGFEHAFYRLGLRDRTLIRLAQYAAVLLLGAWVARQVLARGRLSRAAACSLVALYSTVFLYHRLYDTVILIVPLVYSAAQARLARGTARGLFVGCAVATLVVMYLDIRILGAVDRLSFETGFGGLALQAVVLPCATWLVVLAMILLVKGARPAHQPEARAR